MKVGWVMDALPNHTVFAVGDKIVPRLMDNEILLVVSVMDQRVVRCVVLRSPIEGEQGSNRFVMMEDWSLMNGLPNFIHTQQQIKQGDIVVNWTVDTDTAMIVSHVDGESAQCVNVVMGEYTIHPLDELQILEYHLVSN